MNHCVNWCTGYSQAHLMFSHSCDVVADLSGGAQESIMVEEGESFQDMQQAVQARREKAAENLTKAKRAMKQRFDKRRKVATEYQVGDLVL